MKRALARVLGASLLALSCAALVPTVAEAAPAAPARTAQAAPGFNNCDPRSAGYPPRAAVGLLVRLALLNGTFRFSANGTLSISNLPEPGPWCVILNSTPVVLGDAVAVNGVATWSGFTVPADFELNATHRADVYRFGQLVGSLDFCAKQQSDGTGVAVPVSDTCPGPGGSSRVPQALGSKAKPGNLAYTGFDLLLDILKVAGVAIGVGALFRYAGRRRANGLST